MSLFQKIALGITLILCTVALSLPMIRNGLQYQFGLGFWGPSGHDGIWHLSLINHLVNPLSIINPSFSGEKLSNYHPLFDILAALLAKILHLTPSLVLFQLLPVLMSLILLYLSFIIGRNYTKSSWGGMLLIFLNTFSSSFGWLITLIRDHRFSGESLFWAMQSFSTQINPPYALSLVLLSLFLVILSRPRHKTFDYLTLALLLILLPITKAYGGLIAFSLYTVSCLLKKTRPHLLVLGLSLPSAYFLFRFYNPSSADLLQFNPFWFIRSLFESPDKLYLPKVASYLLNTSFNFPHFIIYCFGIVIFIIGNFGFRSLFVLKGKYFFTNHKYLPLVSTIALSITIPLLFTQKGTAWNTIQFLYYGQFLANILLTCLLVQLKNRPLILLIIIVSLLSNLDNFSNYLGFPPPSSLPKDEIQALKFLDALPSGTVLTYPYNPYFRQNFHSTPIPLYVYETTAYLPAYTHHVAYLADEMNLDNSNYPWQPRRTLSQKFFNQLPQELFENRGFLLENKIDYLYLTGLQRQKTNLNLDKLYLKIIYNQDNTAIYRVLK